MAGSKVLAGAGCSITPSRRLPIAKMHQSQTRGIQRHGVTNRVSRSNDSSSALSIQPLEPKLRPGSVLGGNGQVVDREFERPGANSTAPTRPFAPN